MSRVRAVVRESSLVDMVEGKQFLKVVEMQGRDLDTIGPPNTGIKKLKLQKLSDCLFGLSSCAFLFGAIRFGTFRGRAGQEILNQL